jgi:hypothetical protein
MLAMRLRNYAVSANKILTLMKDAGLAAVKRLDDVLYQPVLIAMEHS